MLLKHEKYIVHKDGEYLVACPYLDSIATRFSISPYDGYPFESFIVAQRIAQKFGGVVMKHNRITGELTGGWA